MHARHNLTQANMQLFALNQIKVRTMHYILSLCHVTNKTVQFFFMTGISFEHWTNCTIGLSLRCGVMQPFPTNTYPSTRLRDIGSLQILDNIKYILKMSKICFGDKCQNVYLPSLQLFWLLLSEQWLCSVIICVMVSSLCSMLLVN